MAVPSSEEESSRWTEGYSRHVETGRDKAAHLAVEEQLVCPLLQPCLIIYVKIRFFKRSVSLVSGAACTEFNTSVEGTHNPKAQMGHCFSSLPRKVASLPRGTP